MILLLCTITIGCLIGVEPLPDEPQENKTSDVSAEPLLYKGFWTDFFVLSLLIIYPVLFCDSVTTINAVDTPWVYSDRIIWLCRFVVDLYNYIEPIPEIRPMPQCRPPWPQHLLEPEVVQPVEPREQLMRYLVRYKLRYLLQFLGVI